MEFEELKKRIDTMEDDLGTLRYSQTNYMEHIQGLSEIVNDIQTDISKTETRLAELKMALRRHRWAQLNAREILGPWAYDDHCNIHFGDESCLTYRDGTYYIIIEDDQYALILEQSEWSSQCLRELEDLLADYCLNANLDVPWCELPHDDYRLGDD